MQSRIHKVVRNALVILLIGALYSTIVLIVGKGIPCPFHLLTGLKCPGCGVSRMFLSMIKLDFVSAFGYNQAIFCLLPLMIFVLIRKTRLYIKTGSAKDKASDILMWIMVFILLVFGIVRNII